MTSLLVMKVTDDTVNVHPVHFLNLHSCVTDEVISCLNRRVLKPVLYGVNSYCYLDCGLGYLLFVSGGDGSATFLKTDSLSVKAGDMNLIYTKHSL